MPNSSSENRLRSKPQNAVFALGMGCSFAFLLQGTNTGNILYTFTSILIVGITITWYEQADNEEE